jgi:hypothetical protein
MAREIRPNLELVDEQQVEGLERELEGTEAEDCAKRAAPYRASGAKHTALP